MNNNLSMINLVGNAPRHGPVSYMERIFVTALLMLTTSIPSFSQDHDKNLEKYWAYRDRLVTQFMVVGNGQGMSMPASHRDTVAQFVKWGDNTIWLGWYIATLTLEYHMLVHPHRYPGFNNGGSHTVSQTLNELYYALHGLQRLDATAESAFPSPCDSLQDEKNGFFIRDDVLSDFHTNFPGMSQIFSDYNSGNVYDKEMSQDQVYHLLMGLALIKKLLPNGLEVNEMNLKQQAIDQAKLIVDWVSQDDWVIKNPVCFDNNMNPKNVARGENAVLLSSGLNEMIKFITDGAVNYDNDLSALSIGVWNSLVAPSNPGYSNPDNLHMAMVIAAVGNGWGDTTLHALMNLADVNKWHAYPLLFSVLHDYASIPGFSNYRKTMNLWADSMMNEAPISGPYNAYPDSVTHGYAVNNRFIRPRSQHYIGNHFTSGSQFQGLDYMLLHNLYYVVSPSKWPVTYEWAPVGATWYYDQEEFGPTPEDSRYNLFESIGDTLINNTPSRVIYHTQYTGDTTYGYGQIYMHNDSNKVYYYWDNDFRLLYDFNAEPGDTFMSYCPDAGIDLIYVIVDSVGEVSINGHRLSVWYVRSDPKGSCNMNGQILERIGWLGFMFPTSGLGDPAWGGPLRCYEDSTIGFYTYQPGKACDFITSVGEIFSNFSIDLYPNPVSDVMVLDISNYQEWSLHFEIFNSIGELVSKRKFTNTSQLEIDVSDFQNGIYLLLLMDGKGNRIASKFVKGN